MEKENWTISDIRKLYDLGERVSKQTLFNAEDRGEIPKANRIDRGKIKVRVWNLSQLPALGNKYGFLPSLNFQLVVCNYIQKGGVLKTTSVYNDARIIALNGKKVLIIGTDYECSITNVALPQKDIKTLDEAEQPLGLYHFFYEKASLDQVIQKTSIPTLDIMPETHELNLLEKNFRYEKRREYIFRDKLLPLLSSYDVIIFDNSPGWNMLIENALTASNAVFSPLGCNLLAYKSVQTNIDTLYEFANEMKLRWIAHIMIPTLLDNSGISQQIYGRYLDKYSNKIIPIPIRYSTKGQESLANRQSILEYAPSSNLATDYRNLIKAKWNILLEYKRGEINGH